MVARFPVRALHEPDGRAHREQVRDVLGRSMEVRLDAHAGVLELLAEPPVDREGRIDVGNRLHVEEQMLAEGGGALREAAQSLERLLRVEVQTQVRRLHGDLGVETSPFDQVEEPEVVLRDGIGVGRALDVLPQERERHRDAFRRKSFRGLEGVLHRLAGHEAPDGRADEPESREVHRPANGSARRGGSFRARDSRKDRLDLAARAEAGLDRPVHVGAPAPGEVAPGERN